MYECEKVFLWLKFLVFSLRAHCCKIGCCSIKRHLMEEESDGVIQEQAPCAVATCIPEESSCFMQEVTGPQHRVFLLVSCESNVRANR